jgi:hypothetical protein
MISQNAEAAVDGPNGQEEAVVEHTGDLSFLDLGTNQIKKPSVSICGNACRVSPPIIVPAINPYISA